MVKVTYQPIQEFVIHEMVKYNSVEDFLNIKTGNIPAGGSAPPARWCEGILYEAFGLPPTQDVVKDQLQGILHFALLEYVEMDEYVPVLKNPSTNVPLPIINVSHNETTKAIIQWMKDR